MQRSALFRLVNTLNPSTRGRLFVRNLALKCGAMPADGRYKTASGFRMDLIMDNIIDRSVYFDAYEPLICRLIQQRLARGGVFIDIGANIGYITLVASKLVGPEGSVLSFEPHPKIYERFLRNVEINSPGNVTPYNVALSDEAGEAELYSPHDGHHGGTSLQNQGWHEEVDTFTVPTKRLDDILPEDVGEVSFIKIDVEGAELLALRGASKTIATHCPDILCEYQRSTAARFGYDPIQIPTEILALCPDYTIYLIPNNRSVIPVSLEELSDLQVERADILMSCR